MALTEEEKSKIREEEKLRAQIRNEYAQDAGPAHIEVTNKKKISSTRESVGNAMWMTKLIIFGFVGLIIVITIMTN